MLADAKQYLKRRNIPLEDDDFTNIKMMLGDKNMKYCYMFTYFRYEMQVEMVTLIALWNKIDSLKDHLDKMPKDVVTYRNPTILMNELIEMEKRIVIDRFSKYLPESLDKEYKAIFALSDKNSLKRQADFEKFLNQFFELNEEYQKDFVKNVSRVKSGTSLLTELKAFVKYVKAGRDIESVKKKELPGLKKLFVDQNTVLCEVLNHNTMKKVGSTSWCITRDSGHWRSYVSDVEGAKQHILWNNQVPMTSVDHLIAFTCSGNGSSINEIVKNAHNRRNTSIVLQDYINKYNLQMLLPFIGVKNDFDRIMEVLESIQNGSSKKKANQPVPVNPNEPDELNNLRNMNFTRKELIMQLSSSKTMDVISLYQNGVILKLINDSQNTKSAIVLYFISIQLFNDNRFWDCFLKNYAPKHELSLLEVSMLKEVLKAILRQNLDTNNQKGLYYALVRKVFTTRENSFWINVLPEFIRFIQARQDNLDNFLAREIKNIYQRVLQNIPIAARRTSTDVLAINKLMKLLKVEETVIEEKKGLNSFDNFLRQERANAPVIAAAQPAAGAIRYPAPVEEADITAWLTSQWQEINPHGERFQDQIHRREEDERVEDDDLEDEDGPINEVEEFDEDREDINQDDEFIEEDFEDEEGA